MVLNFFCICEKKMKFCEISTHILTSAKHNIIMELAIVKREC